MGESGKKFLELLAKGSAKEAIMKAQFPNIRHFRTHIAFARLLHEVIEKKYQQSEDDKVSFSSLNKYG